MKNNVAILVGNGLSIAINPDLALASITKEVMERITEENGDEYTHVVKEIADRTLPSGAHSEDDFEMLVGAFGAESKTLDLLSTLAELSTQYDEEMQEAIEKVSKFAERVKETGLSYVLEIIGERSRAEDAVIKPLAGLLDAIVEGFSGKIVFANLNYDTLLLAGLMRQCPHELADLGDGRKCVTINLPNGNKHEVQTLRTEDDFPQDRRVKLLHLHGSLTFWGDPEKKQYAKLPIHILNETNLWEGMRNRHKNTSPQVILARTKDKSEQVAVFPFSLAYEVCAKDLSKAEYWLIVGYSFRDIPVNEMLRSAFMDCPTKPHVLVVTYGSDLDTVVVERALGWGAEDGSSDKWLTIYRDGAIGAQKSAEWKEWSKE